MSGIEVAGIVLGALPLVISALENYKAGKGAMSSILKWKGHLDHLIFQLKVQHKTFYLHISTLLLDAGVGEIDDKRDLTENECASILRDAKTGYELKKYLGNVYGLFLEILGRYECSGLWCTVEVEGGTNFYRTTGTQKINTGGVEELVECY